MGDLTRLSEALTGRYTVEQELGAGGMATVYLALDLRHGRRVGLKVLRPELAARVVPGDPPRVEARRVVMDAFPSEPVGRFVVAEPEQRGRLGLIFNWASPEGAEP